MSLGLLPSPQQSPGSKKHMDTRGSMHDPSTLPVMSEEFGESQPSQHREGGHLQMDGPAGLGVVESGVGHPQAYGHAQTNGQGGLQSPSIEHHRHATPPSSFPQSVSSIGTYETSGTVVTQRPASRHTSTSQTWPAPPRDYTRQQLGPEMNPTAQTMQQAHQAQMQRQQGLLQTEQSQQLQHDLKHDHHKQNMGPLNDSGASFESLNQQSKQQQQQQQRMKNQTVSLEQQRLQQSWQAQSQQETENQQEQQQQAQQRMQGVQIRPGSWLNDYVPPADFAHVNVRALMMQCSATMANWERLQETLDVTSESSTSNFSAQARARASLKNDLTNLMKLADAQTKHMQRARMRYTQEAPNNNGGVPVAPSAASTSSLLPSTSGGQGGPTGEGYNHPPKESAVPVSVTRGQPMVPSPLAPGNPINLALMQHGGGGDARGSSSATQADFSEESRTRWQPTEWPTDTLSPRSTTLPVTSSPVQPPQHSIPLQSRLQEVKQRLDRAEPRKKWVVLVDASLRLLPNEGPTFEQFFMNIQSFLKKFNGPVGAEVALALQSCFDQRVFDPTDITRAQRRMADIFSQCGRRGQR